MTVRGGGAPAQLPAARAAAEIADWLDLPEATRFLRSPSSISPELGWSRSGGKAMTAFAGSPPGDVTARVSALAALLEYLTRDAKRVSIEGPEIIGQREALSSTGHVPSPGRTLRRNGWMLRAIGGWIALTMARTTDPDLIPALTDGALAAGHVEDLSSWVAGRQRGEVIERCHLLGLAASTVPEPGSATARERPWSAGDGEPLDASHRRQLVVADMSSLWAGPLAASLLGQSGAHVLRIESASRPAIPAAADSRFFQHLNGTKEHVVLDFGDRAKLYDVLDDADIVVLSARPRAIAELGLRRRPGQIWIRITGYGSDPANAHRVGFGDDAAAGAGAVYWHDGAPNFCADALADPVTGLLAAVIAMGFVARREATTVDLSLQVAMRWAISGSTG